MEEGHRRYTSSKSISCQVYSVSLAISVPLDVHKSAFSNRQSDASRCVEHQPVLGKIHANKLPNIFDNVLDSLLRLSYSVLSLNSPLSSSYFIINVYIFCGFFCWFFCVCVCVALSLFYSLIFVLQSQA